MLYSSYLDSVVGAVRVVGAAVYRGGSHPPPSAPVDLHVGLHTWPTTKKFSVNSVLQLYKQSM